LLVGISLKVKLVVPNAVNNKEYVVPEVLIITGVGPLVTFIIFKGLNICAISY
jgi:hypothetical protein